MTLKVINSNSAGNCYLMQAENGDTLLVECGVDFKKIRQAMEFRTDRIVGCIISHNHLDHCKGAELVAKAGIDIFTSQGTIDELGFVHHRLRPVKAHQAFDIGPFRILPFDVRHDCKEPLCYLIKHPECGVTLFLTDSYYCAYKFEGLNNVIVEANYCQSIIDRKMAEGVAPRFLRNRILQSHMSLKTCKEFLQANDLTAVNNIVLIHLSDRNSDAIRFQREIQELTGKTVHVADAGLVIENFNINPF
ncbi:MAG TPA: MBL fold metallo-hydrolase [Flavitalea sp.]|nr:MBL fold metallo-hydrolase [Flavitalea sp.]